MSKWKMVRLEDVCDILDNMRVPIKASERKPGPYPYYGANGVQDYVADYIFDDELVLLAEDGGSFGSKDKPIAYRVSGKCWVNNHAHVLKPKNMLDVDYLCYSIMFYDVRPLISGTTRPKLNQAAMRKMTIPLPPLEVQRQIADVLGRANALIEKRKAQIDKLDLLVKSQFIEMFGDPITNPKGWEIRRIEGISEKGKNGIKAGPFGSSLKKEFYTERGFKIYGQEQVINGDPDYGDYYISESKYKELESCAIKAGDVLISLVGTYGKLLIIPEIYQEGIINPRLMKISLNQSIVIPIYFKYYFTSMAMISVMKEIARGGTMDILNVGLVKKLKIPVPPLALQSQFADFVQQVETQKSRLNQSLEKLEISYKSLMQKCFRGEIF